MKRKSLKSFTRGWVIGDFTPSLMRTKNFEVTVKHYKKGDKEKKHFHKEAIEYTIIVSGSFKMNETVVKKDDIMIVDKNEAVEFECLEDGSNVVIKIPSVIGDKYLV